MTIRAPSALVAACLVICLAGGSLAAPPPQDNGQAAPGSWNISPELLAQGAGALVGFGVFSLFVAPQVTVAEGVVAVLGGRLVAATLAGAGAMAGTFIYDRWAGQPLDYAYFWHRGGFIGGVAAGIAAFGLLGYPIDGGASWLGWAANRATILGSGLMRLGSGPPVPGAGSVGQAAMAVALEPPCDMAAAHDCLIAGSSGAGRVTSS